MNILSVSTRERLLLLLQETVAAAPTTPVSLSDLAHTLGVSRERIRVLYRQLAREYPLPPVKNKGSWSKETRRKQTARKQTKEQDIAQKIKALRDKGVSYQQIVAEHGIRISQAQKAITKLIREGETSHKLTSPETLAFEAKVQAYRAQGMTGDEIAERTGKHRTSVYAALRRLDIPLSKRTRKSEETSRRLKNPKFLAFAAAAQAYRAQGMSGNEIAKRTGRPRSTVYRVIHQLDPSLRKYRHQTR
jgi:transposase/biotin operon repressor